MNKKLFAVLLLSIALPTLPAFAIEDTDISDDGQEMEVKHVLYGSIKDKQIYSLNNYATDAATSGASVDIITREDIKAQNTPELSTLLNQTTSVTFGQGSGGYGQPSSLMIRGSNRVLFSLDGVRIDNPAHTARTTDLRNYLMSDDIERIEVIRGPQGTIAGHTASGGMIAARTRRGSGKLTTEASSLFGNYGYFKERFAIMGGNESGDHYTAINWFKTDDGTYLENNGRRGDNTYNNLGLVGNYAVRFLEGKAELRDIIRYNRGRKNIGMNLYPMYNEGYGSEDYDYAISNDFSNSLVWTHDVNEKYSYDVSTTLFNTNYAMHYNPSSSDYSNYKYSQNATRFNIGTQHNIKLTSWDTFSLGYNLETENYVLNSKGQEDWGYYLNPLSQHERGRTIQHDVYAQDCINIKDILFIRGGARFSTNSKYGSWVSPNASAALVLPTFNVEGAKTTFRGSWGMNKNTPTLYQRFGDGGTYVIPNSDLDPEKMNSWDAGITQSFANGKITLDFGYFQSSYKDYIGYGYTPYWQGYYYNINRVYINGYEGKITWTPNEKFKAIVNYTFTDAKNKDTGANLDLVSKNRVNGTLVWSPVERLNAYIGVEAGTDRQVSNVKLPGYIDLNIGGQVRLFTWKDAKFYLQGDLYNLLNQKIACGYYGGGRILAPGMNFRLGLFVKYDMPEKSKKETL
jgi:vitamin B12 transporter